jgi:hypothetical protein
LFLFISDLSTRLARARQRENTHMPQRSVTRLVRLSALAVIALFAAGVPSAKAAFHLWQVKEAFTNSDGSVQFVEMFDSFGGETSTNGLTITANSDGNIKTFTFPSNLSLNTPGHLLIASTGFGSLPGGVTPDFTFASGGVTLPFFNPNAMNITLTFSGNGDSMSFTGASLPKDGINSLTDSGAVGFPPGTPSISSGTNSPTNLAGSSGSVNVSPEPVSSALLMIPLLGLLHRRRPRNLT